MLPCPRQNLYPSSRRRGSILRKTAPQRVVVQQGTICCGASSTLFLSLQVVSSLHPDPSSIPPSKCCPGVDGMHRFGHALLARHLLVGSLVHLHSKDELEGKVQFGCPLSFPPVGDRASRLKQRWGKGPCPCL